MDLEDIVLNEISQTQTDRLYDVTFMWNFKFKKVKLIVRESNGGYQRLEWG